jgi:hypothetical protein
MSNNNEVWSKESMQQIYNTIANRPSDDNGTTVNVSTNRQKKPLHKNSIARAVFVLTSVSAIGAGINFLLNGGGDKKAAAIQQEEKVSDVDKEDKGGWENAAEQSTSTGMGIDVDQKTDDKTQQGEKSDPTKLKTVDQAKSDAKSDTATAVNTVATQPKAPIQPVAPISSPKVTAPSSPQVAAAPKQSSVVYAPPKPSPITNTPAITGSRNDDKAKVKELEARLAKQSSLTALTPNPINQPPKNSNDQTEKIKDLEAKLALAKKPVQSNSIAAASVAPLARVAALPKTQRVQQALESLPSGVKIASSISAPTTRSITNSDQAKITEQEARIKKLELKIAEVAMNNSKSDKKSVVDSLRPPTTEPIESAKVSTKTSDIEQVPPPLISSSISDSKSDSKPDSKSNTTTSPSLLLVDGKVEGRLIDSIAGSATNENVGSPQVRIKLTGAIPTSNGGEIPINSIVAMTIKVSAQTGVVTGTSFGVWDTLGQPLDIPVGSLALESKSGLPLVAQAVALNKGAGDADTVASVWGAVGAGVDAVTRPNTNTIVTSGGAVVSSTDGGNRDFLTSALGGFARSKAQFEQQEALRRRAEAEAQSKLWYIPKDSIVVISVRAPQPINQLNYRQYQPAAYSNRQYPDYSQAQYQAPQQQTNIPVIAPGQRPQIPQINQAIQQPYTPSGYPIIRLPYQQ